MEKEKGKGFSLHTDQRATNCGSLGKPIQKENPKASLDENRPPLALESALLVSERCKPLKRKQCLEGLQSSDVPTKIMKKGRMLSFVMNVVYELARRFGEIWW